jgi:hypothetical protein
MSALLADGIKTLDQYGGNYLSVIARKDGQPACAVIVVCGVPECEEILEAVDAVREEWHAEEDEE